MLSFMHDYIVTLHFQMMQ